MADTRPLLEIGGIGAIILTYISIASTGLLEPLDAVMIFDYTLLQFILYTLIFFGIGVIIMNIIVALMLKKGGADISDIKKAAQRAESEVTEFVESVSGLSNKEAKRVTDNVKSQYKTAAKKSGSKLIGKSKAKVNVVIREGIPSPEELRVKFRNVIPESKIMAVNTAYPEDMVVIPSDSEEIFIPLVKNATKDGLFRKGQSRMRQIIKYIGLAALSAMILTIVQFFTQ